jgi:hypothetical protein
MCAAVERESRETLALGHQATFALGVDSRIVFLYNNKLYSKHKQNKQMLWRIWYFTLDFRKITLVLIAISAKECEGESFKQSGAHLHL